MLQITPDATRHLARVRRERGFGETDAPRFVRNGERVALTFAARPQPGDKVLDQAGSEVYLAPEVAPALEESVIDARLEEGKVVLVIRQDRSSMSSRPASLDG